MAGWGEGGELDAHFAVAREQQDDIEAQRIRARVLDGLTAGGGDPVRVGRYLVIERLGAGAMGVVYAAFDPKLDRRVAIKVVHPEAAGSEARLEREGKALARLTHPNVVALHDVVPVGDDTGLVMELVDGIELEAWLAQESRTWPQIAAVFAAAARGLAAAHEAGVTHRDFKPANVLVGADGRARVLDFGLASATRHHAGSPSDLGLTSAGAVLGTAYYMAPEQHRGEAADAAADQYAFCVALHEALYGVRPFEGANAHELRLAKDRYAGAVPSGGGVPGRLGTLIARGLSPDPRRRFDSMLTIAAELERKPGAHLKWAVGLVGLVAVGLGVAAIVPYGGPECDGASELNEVWDPTRSRALNDALLATGRPFATDTAATVTTKLDAYRDRWLASYDATCAAKGEQSAQLFDLRMLCLQQRRADLDATVDMLLGDADTVIGRAVMAVDALRVVDGCNDIAAIHAGEIPAQTVLEAEAATRVHERVAAVDALVAGGDFEQARATAQTVLAEFTDATPGRARAEVLLSRARAEVLLQLRAEATETLHDALAAAERAEADDVRATVLLELVGLLTPVPEHRELGRGYGRQASAVMDRIAAPDDLRAELAARMAQLELEDGRLDAAQNHATEALARAGSRVELSALAQEVQATVYLQRGRPADALRHQQRAVGLRASSLGSEHPSVGFARLALAGALEAAGELGEAQQEARAALAILEEGLDARDPGLSEVRREVARIQSSSR